MENVTKMLLECVLNNSNINHQFEIVKQNSLKDAHIYCKIHKLSGQRVGPLIENYIKIKYKMYKNNASKCIGDLNHNGINFEIKTSLGGMSGKKFNFVQIRFNHECEYLLTTYHLCHTNLDSFGDIYVFKLKKDDMKHLVLQYGTYSHGTISKLGKITKESLDSTNNDCEYSLRPSIDSKCWNDLLQFKTLNCKV